MNLTQIIYFLTRKKYTKDMVDKWDVMTPDEVFLGVDLAKGKDYTVINGEVVKDAKKQQGKAKKKKKGE